MIWKVSSTRFLTSNNIILFTIFTCTKEIVMEWKPTLCQDSFLVAEFTKKRQLSHICDEAFQALPIEEIPTTEG